jgi:hypothetical protein
VTNRRASATTSGEFSNVRRSFMRPCARRRRGQSLR